jgi:hypothetical protein
MTISIWSLPEELCRIATLFQIEVIYNIQFLTGTVHRRAARIGGGRTGGQAQQGRAGSKTKTIT